MTVHVLLFQGQYDGDVLGVFADPELGRAAGDRQFAAMLHAPWHRDRRDGHVRKLGSSGDYLWLKPIEVTGAVLAP
jgi:hypothetical protein